MGHDEPVRVVVERSGGFAGVVRRGETDTSQLDDATAQQLHDLVAGAGEPAGGSTRSGSRRDGFCYDLTVDDGADGVRQLQLREGALPSGARQLLDRLLR